MIFTQARYQIFRSEILELKLIIENNWTRILAWNKNEIIRPSPQNGVHGNINFF